MVQYTNLFKCKEDFTFIEKLNSIYKYILKKYPNITFIFNPNKSYIEIRYKVTDHDKSYVSRVGLSEKERKDLLDKLHLNYISYIEDKQKETQNVIEDYINECREQ